MIKKSLVLILLGSAVALLAWRDLKKAPLTYQTAKITRGDVQATVITTGMVSAILTVQVGSQVSGIVNKLYADYNSVVKKGQLVAEIDPAPFQAKLDQANAQLDSAKASLLAAQATVQKARADISGAQQQAQSQHNQTAVAQSAENFANTEYKRQAALVDASIGTVDDRDSAKSNYDVAIATREAAQAQEDEAGVQIGADEEALKGDQTQVEIANANIKQAESVVQQAQLDLDHTKITSPTDGIVISRDVELGQTVSANFSAPVLFEIAQDLSRMQLDANIDESDISRIENGETATFTVDALPNSTFTATVSQVRKNPVNVQNVITYDVIMPLTSSDPRLYPGMTANIHLLTGTHTNVLLAPTGALRYRPKDVKTPTTVRGSTPPQFIYVLDSKGQPQSRRVQIGYADTRNTEITSGDIQEGDSVIIGEGYKKS